MPKGLRGRPLIIWGWCKTKKKSVQGASEKKESDWTRTVIFLEHRSKFPTSLLVIDDRFHRQVLGLHKQCQVLFILKEYTTHSQNIHESIPLSYYSLEEQVCKFNSFQSDHTAVLLIKLWRHIDASYFVTNSWQGEQNLFRSLPKMITFFRICSPRCRTDVVFRMQTVNIELILTSSQNEYQNIQETGENSKSSWQNKIYQGFIWHILTSSENFFLILKFESIKRGYHIYIECMMNT